MSDRDLPSQGLLQQMNSHKVSGEHLETLGKRAAALWTSGQVKSLNEAVVDTVKTAGLSPEQVRRVIEFTNTAAYLTEFHKEGATHHVVDFGAGGLADPSFILQDLNDGGGGSTYDTGSFDYSNPPVHTKTASVSEEEAFAQAFSSSGVGYPEVNPLGDVLELRDKLASAYDNTTATLSMLEGVYEDLSERLFHQVKQAALSGHSLSEVAEIWQQAAPSDEHVKVAFAVVMDRLVDNEVFHNHEEVVESLMKHAAQRVVNQEHPLVVDFKEFCETTTKLAEVRAAQQEFGEGVAQLTEYIKGANAEDGVLVKAVDAYSRGAGHVGHGAQWLAEKAIGQGGTSKAFGTAARLGTKYVLPAVAANEVYRHTLKHNPTAQKVRSAIVSATPGTEAYRQKEYGLAMRAQGYGGQQ